MIMHLYESREPAKDRSGGAPLERFQKKRTPLFRLENATTQGFRALVPMQSEREML
jgi:hypothetical protein